MADTVAWLVELEELRARVRALESSGPRERDMAYWRGYRDGLHNLKLLVMEQETNAGQKLNDVAVFNDDE